MDKFLRVVGIYAMPSDFKRTPDDDGLYCSVYLTSGMKNYQLDLYEKVVEGDYPSIRETEGRAVLRISFGKARVHYKPVKPLYFPDIPKNEYNFVEIDLSKYPNGTLELDWLQITKKGRTFFPASGGFTIKESLFQKV